MPMATPGMRVPLGNTVRPEPRVHPIAPSGTMLHRSAQPTAFDTSSARSSCLGVPKPSPCPSSSSLSSSSPSAAAQVAVTSTYTGAKNTTTASDRDAKAFVSSAAGPSTYMHAATTTTSVSTSTASPWDSGLVKPRAQPSSWPVPLAPERAFGASSPELQQMQQSVQRLKAQRAHVEYLRQHAERLEAEVSERTKENEALRRQVNALRGVEQENVGLVQSFTRMEERIASLEAICQEKRKEVKAMMQQLQEAEAARDQAQLQVEDAQGHAQQRMHQMEQQHAALRQQIATLEAQCKAQSDQLAQVQEAYRDQMTSAQQHDHSYRKQLETTNKMLEDEIAEQEKQIRQLLHTTTRQTGVIEDCDRALSEVKAQREQLQRSIATLRQENDELQGQVEQAQGHAKEMEAKCQAIQQQYDAELNDLRVQSAKRKDRIDLFQFALREKEKRIESEQQIVRDRERECAEKDARIRDLEDQAKAVQGELSTLKMGVRETADENCMLRDQVLSLQKQLETERKDRSRWATARLKLLAEFCDEEHKLSHTLNEWLHVQDRQETTRHRSKAPSNSWSSLLFQGDDGHEQDSASDDMSQDHLVFG